MSVRKTPPIKLSDGRHGCTSLVALGACLKPTRSLAAIKKWKKSHSKKFPTKKNAYVEIHALGGIISAHPVKVWIVEEMESFRRKNLTEAKMRTTVPSDTDQQGELDLGDEELTERQKLELGKLRAATRLQTLKADHLAGRFIERVQHNGLMVALIKMVRGKIEEWLEGLPPQLENCSAVECREALQDVYDLLCDDMYNTTHLKPAPPEEVAEFMLGPSAAKSKAGAAGVASRKRKAVTS